MKKLAPGLMLGAVFIYLYEYTDAITAPVNDPLGFLGNQMSPLTPNQQIKNLNAGLKTIRHWESSDNDAKAYRMLYGGGLFNGFSDHPRNAQPMGNGQFSTAAGAYQILAISKTPQGMTKQDTWDRIKKKLKLKDFSPASQDAAAIELIKQRGGYYDLINGRFTSFVDKIKLEWASVPGSPYGQPRATLSAYADAFKSFGGVIENV